MTADTGNAFGQLGWGMMRRQPFCVIEHDAHPPLA